MARCANGWFATSPKGRHRFCSFRGAFGLHLLPEYGDNTTNCVKNTARHQDILLLAMYYYIYIHILIIYIYIYWNTHCYHLSHHLPIWTVCGKSQLKTYQLHHDWCILAIIAIHSGLSVFIWQTSRWWWHGKIFSGEWAHWTILYGCGQNLTW